MSKAQKSKLAWRAKRKRELTEDWRPTECGLCELTIWLPEDAELDHKIPVRRGGDTDENTHLVHTLGNRAKGSVELAKYLTLPLDVRRKNCGLNL